MAHAFDQHLRVAAVTIVFLIGFAGWASSQTFQTSESPVPHRWSHGTTLELSAGAAHAAPNTSAAFGAAIGWELNHHAEIEGVAAWLPERHGAESFAADLKLLVNLTRPARVVPYLGAGAGLYFAAFDTTQATLPPFYQQHRPDSSTPGRATFTNPTIVIAGGANVFTAHHLSVRPDLGVRLVMDGSHVYTVTTAAFSLIYHFDNHPTER